MLLNKVSRLNKLSKFSISSNKPKEVIGEIDDLKYFNNKMARGLRVPSSYLPTGPDDSDRALTDGKVGTALIQEYRFNQYCERLQALIVQKLDDEFKMFLKWRGFNIERDFCCSNALDFDYNIGTDQRRTFQSSCISRNALSKSNLNYRCIDLHYFADLRRDYRCNSGQLNV